MTSQSYENYGEVPHLLLIITLLFMTFVKDFKPRSEDNRQ